MNFRQKLDGFKALALVAHPDDETIWLGGFILRHPEINWTIFSLSRASDPDRRPKFLSACCYFKAKAIIADLPDSGRLNAKRLIPLIEKIVIKKLSQSAKKQYNFIFTHGKNGEYGHPVHAAAHQAVKSLLKKNKLKTATFLCFNYKKSRRPAALANSDLTIYLTAKEFKNKKAVMTEIYGFDPAGIDTNYCTNPEAFKIIK